MAGEPLTRAQPAPEIGLRLLALIRQMVAEARPGLAAEPALASSLERDLGLDSLARVELLGRVEREFDLRLAEDSLGRLNTPADLIRLVAEALAGPTGGAMPSVPGANGLYVAGESAARPEEAATLVDVLEWHAALQPGRQHVTFLARDGEEVHLSYGALLQDARAVAAGLAAGGLRPGQAVAIMLPSGLDFFRGFFGALLAGGVPAPLYPPASLPGLEEHLRLQAGILANCEAPVLVTMAEARLAARLLRARVASLGRICTVAELSSDAAPALAPPPRAADLALLQYTSGSTGKPKGVMLSHANLLANIRAFSRQLAVCPDDVCVSWLPLYHDMGLIGAWLGSLYNGCRLVLMSPLSFLARPELWLRALHRHGGTVSAAPNFAYELCLHRIPDRELDGLDLSRWRLALNGAETVSPATVEAFCNRFAPCGFRRAAMKPVYGLAECALALAMPQPDELPRVECIDRDALLTRGEVLPAAQEGSATLRFVACGRVLPGHELRVVGADGEALPERRVGRVQFRGPSACAGYFHNPEATRALLQGRDGDAWRDSGDLAYLADGRLYPTGRVKDIIVRGGRNLHPEALEEAIGRLPGVRKGCVAVFGTADAAAGTERVVAVVETRSEDTARRRELARCINTLAVDLLGVAVDEVVLAPPRSVQKTSSGKIRRAATRERYLAGTLGQPAPPPWCQLAGLIVPALRGHAGQLGRRAGAILYTAYAWTVFGLVAVPVWAAVALDPRPARNWGRCHRAARLFLCLAGVRLTVAGERELPAAGCVVAINHASYLDGLLLVAALPRPLAFVAKGELAQRLFTGRLLGGLGAHFVERFDARRSVEDARRLAALAKAGERLAFFPEGTFTRSAGLRPFYMGAFLAAVESGLPVVPIAIAGSRTLLPADSLLLTRAAVTIDIGAPLAPGGNDWDAARMLRDAVRAYILLRCGEPDLATVPGAAAIPRREADG